MTENRHKNLHAVRSHLYDIHTKRQKSISASKELSTLENTREMLDGEKGEEITAERIECKKVID